MPSGGQTVPKSLICGQLRNAHRYQNYVRLEGHFLRFSAMFKSTLSPLFLATFNKGVHKMKI